MTDVASGESSARNLSTSKNLIRALDQSVGLATAPVVVDVALAMTVPLGVDHVDETGRAHR